MKYGRLFTLFTVFLLLPTPLLGMAGSAWPARSAALSATLTAFHRSGQTFLTWPERADLSGERYRLYRHTQPITEANLAQAAFLYEVAEGSGRFFANRYNVNSSGVWDYRYLERFVIQDGGDPLAPGVGLLVWTLAPQDFGGGTAGTAYYAVTLVDGAAETLLAASTAALDESVADPLPVEVPAGLVDVGPGGHLYIQYMDLRAWNPTFHAPNPLDGFYGLDAGDPAVAGAIQYAYDYVVYEPTPDLCGGSVPAQVPALVSLHGWSGNSYAPFIEHPDPYWCIYAIYPVDVNQTWFFGFARDHDFRLGGTPGAGDTIVNYTEQRVLRMLYDLLRDPPGPAVDPQRAYVFGGSMGGAALAFALRYPDVFAAAYASQPMTDYATSGDAGGTDWRNDLVPKWGSLASNLPVQSAAPADWAAHLVAYDGSGVWDWQDHQANVRERVADEMAPFGVGHARGDMVIEWPTQGSPAYAAFNAGRRAWGGAVIDGGHSWMSWHGLPPELDTDLSLTPFFHFGVLRDESVPGLSNASGDLPLPPPGSGPEGGYNQTIKWSASWDAWDGPPVDEVDRWQISLCTKSNDPYVTSCETGVTQTVDVTPRRLQRFAVTPGASYAWENRRVTDGALVDSGTVTADAGGLLTVVGFTVSTAGNRLLLQPVRSPRLLYLPVVLRGGITPPPALAARSLYIPLTVQERAGVVRVQEPVQSGVPLPRAAQISDPAGLALLDAETGQVVDADFLVLARWGGAPVSTTLPIKWLLLTFRASVPAVGSARFILTDYRPNPPAQRITLDRSHPDYWVVDTGAARFEIATSGFDLFHRVTLAGQAQDLIAPDADNGPYYTLSGADYAAARAQGGSDLRLYRAGSYSQTLTLAARGSHRTFDAREDDDLDFNTYLTFYAGSPAVRVQHTVQNNRDWVALENNADFRNVGSPHAVYADEIGLRLNLDLGGGAVWSVLTSTHGLPLGRSLGQAVAVYQDSSGDANWDLWRNRRATGSGTVDTPIYGPSSYVTFRGFELREGGSAVAAGDKMTGYLDVTGANGGLTVAVRDFWQNFPKALRAVPAAQNRTQVQVALLPGEFRARHTLRVGEQKTHDVLFYFHPPGAPDVLQVGAGFARPLLALAPAAWYAETTRAVPTVSAGAEAAYRFTPIPGDPARLVPDVTPAEWDAYLLRHAAGPGASSYVGSPTHDYSFDGLDEALPAAQMYGWMDYGDVPIDFEQQYPECGGETRSISGQYGWKYDGDYGLLAEFLRSGDYRFFDYGLAAAAHTADVDILHHGRQSGRGIHDFRDGGAFGHEQHDQDGDRNPHRNGDPQSPCGSDGWNGTPTADMVYGAGALDLAYWLTGQPYLEESARDLADWTAFYALNHDTDWGRGSANVLNTLAWAFELTGDARYRSAADQVIARNAVLARPMQGGWFGGYLGSALGHYVATLHEAGDYSQDAALQAVVGGASGTPAELDAYSGDLCRADAYAWAAALLPRDRALNLARADAAFASGALYPAWEGNYYGIARVWQIKEWVLALRCGHAYQLATYDLRGGPGFVPSAPPVVPLGGAALQNSPPVARIAGGASVAGSTGSALRFDASLSTDAESVSPALRTTWDFGDGATAAGTVVTHTYESSGTWTVRLWVSDGEGVGLAQQRVQVAFTNHAPLAQAGPDRVAPQGVSLHFDGSASADPDRQPLSYLWDFGDGASGSGASAAHAYAAAGSYTVTLTVSDGDLSGSDAAAVLIRPVAATSVTLSFQDGVGGYIGTRDTYLFCCLGANVNYGDNPELAAGRQSYPELNSLIRFDLSGVPSGARVESAVLELSVSDPGVNGPGSPVEIYRATTGWVEGTGWDDHAAATWTTYDGVHAWNNPDGGGDRADADPISFTAGAAGTRHAVDVGPIVQDWLLGAPNDGFLLTGGPGKNYWYLWFHSRQVADVAVRPRLVLTYTPLAPAAVRAAGRR